MTPAPNVAPGTAPAAPIVVPQKTSANFATLEDVLAYLMSYRVQDFYARVVSALPMREDRKVPMAAVTFERGHHVFLYNPDWVDKMLTAGKFGFEELRATIAHEAMHVVLTHIGRQLKLYRSFTDEKERRRFLQNSNIASDFAVNTLLAQEYDVVNGHRKAYPSLADNEKEWALPKQMHMPEELSYDWYTTLLLNSNQCRECAKEEYESGKKAGKCPHKKKSDNPGQGGTSGLPGGQHCGGHDPYWIDMVEDLTDEEIEVLVSELEGDSTTIIKAAIEEHEKSRGTVPAAVKQQLEVLLKPTPVPWRKLLHQFITRCHLSRPKRSMERPRKRFLNLGSTLFPGRKWDKTFHVGFFIDTSGSMADEDIKTGLEELQTILKINPDMVVTTAQFDTSVPPEGIKELKANTDVSDFVRLRSGGTDFNKAFELALELEKKGKIDAIIIFTDGYAPAPELTCRPRHIPTLWCLTDGGVHPAPGFGYEIRRPNSRQGERYY